MASPVRVDLASLEIALQSCDLGAAFSSVLPRSDATEAARGSCGTFGEGPHGHYLHHPCVHVIEQVAVKEPVTFLIG